MQKYKFLSHTADIKFQAFGNDLEQCFANAGLALVNIICKDKIEAKRKKIIRVKGKDKENLLYNFLEEFLYLFEVGEFLVSEIKNIKIESLFKIRNKKKNYEMRLTAEVYGDDVKNYEADTHVKAITYNDMFVKQENIKGKKRFVCQVVVDV